MPSSDPTHGTSQFINRGDYPSPLDITLVVPTQLSGKPGFFTFTGAGSVMRIAIPWSANTITYRYDGQLKVLNTEENGVPALRMDLLQFFAETTHPLVPPGVSGWSWDTRWTDGGDVYDDIELTEDSFICFNEAQA